MSKYVSDEQVRTWIQHVQRNNDDRAKEHILMAFKDLVDKIVRKYSRTRDDYDDLYQVAMAALMKAIKRFNLKNDNKFMTYAIPCVTGEIKNYFKSMWAIEVPVKTKENYKRIQVAIEDFTSLHGYKPTSKELATYLEMDIHEIREQLQAMTHFTALSWHAPSNHHQEEGQAAYEDVIGAEDMSYSAVEEQLFMNYVLSKLNENEARAIYQLFVNQLSQDEVAKKLEISQMQVSRLRRRALEKIKRLYEQIVYTSI